MRRMVQEIDRRNKERQVAARFFNGIVVVLGMHGNFLSDLPRL